MNTIFKIIVSILLFVGGCYLGFKLDQMAVEWIMSKVPQTDWRELIEVGAWILILITTLSTIVGISLVVSALFLKATVRPEYPRSDGRIKSRWQQRLDEALKEREKYKV